MTWIGARRVACRGSRRQRGAVTDDGRSDGLTAGSWVASLTDDEVRRHFPESVLDLDD